jgi:hypothetical protein
MKKIIRRLVTYPQRRYIKRAFRNKTQSEVYKNYIKEKGYIFIHIPKCGGKSVAMAVYGNDKPGHYSASEYHYYDPRFYEESFKFSFIRDPISRFISAYKFLKHKEHQNYGDFYFSKKVVGCYKDINDFVLNWCSPRNILKKEHFIPQCYFLKNNDGLIDLDFLGRCENLAEDFEILRGLIEIDGTLNHINRSPGNSNEVLSDASLAKLKLLYLKDYEEFNF